MIHITRSMSKAKGCEYCTDKVYRFSDGKRKTFCPYNACKYKEMDDCKDYEEYFHKELPLSPEINSLFAMFREPEAPLKKCKYLPR